MISDLMNASLTISGEKFYHQFLATCDFVVSRARGQKLGTDGAPAFLDSSAKASKKAHVNFFCSSNPLCTGQRMEVEHKSVEIVSADGRSFTGEFRLWDMSPIDPDKVRLELAFANKLFVADADNYFDALISIRTEIETEGLRPRCLGAAEQVYPSGMSRGMGVGDKAYRLTMGRQATMKDLVDIFDVDAETQPASVETQRTYFDKWFSSIG